MLILLSPAKTLDMSPADTAATQPRLLEHTAQLADTLRTKSAEELGRLMSISDKLAELNYGRYQDFSLPLTAADRAKPALLAFKGDVYQDLAADDFTERELDFADRQLRILTVHFRELRSGCYQCITFTAKRARGQLARLITLEGITTAEPIKDLAVNDYVYHEELSTADEWVFTRD